MSYEVRAATETDIPAMARVHVDTWKTTYRGIVPDERLNGMTYESDLARGFGRWVKEPPTGQSTFVALGTGGVVGFATCGYLREPDPEFLGELGAIYVLKEHQGKGIGRALVREVATYLHGLGLQNMLVWVLEQNPYRRFYEKLGGISVRTRVATVAGAPLPEIGYGWRELLPLTK